jgi:hypothetical protein
MVVKPMIMYVDLSVNGPFFLGHISRVGWILGKYIFKIKFTTDISIWISDIT